MAITMDSITEKLQNAAGVLQDNKYFGGISKGLLGIMPIILIGSIASLINTLPIDVYQNFLTSTGISAYLKLAINVTTNMLALYAVFLIGYTVSKNFNSNGMNAGLLSLLSFFLVTPITLGEGDAFSLPSQWLGSAGLFVAILIGLFVGRVYAFLLSKGVNIKMPDSVPPSVTNSFAGLIPGVIIVAIFLCLKALFAITPFDNFHSFIYQFLQTPLENLGGSFWAFLLTIGFLISVFWLVGIHGTLVVFSVMLPIYLALDVANMSAYAAGQPLPNIVGLNFMLVYGMGSGCSFALAFLMVRAKSQRYKALGKIAFPSAIFGISEPVIFGTPIILNPVLAVPFVVNPLISYSLAYFLTTIDILPRLGIQAPMGVPPVINGFIAGGWRVALFQIILFVINLAIYYPFFKALDKQAEKAETEVDSQSVPVPN